MISPKASQRLDDYQSACSSKNRTEKEFTLRQREPTAEGGKCREREHLTQARVMSAERRVTGRPSAKSLKNGEPRRGFISEAPSVFGPSMDWWLGPAAPRTHVRGNT
jgi:hypothetical protein